MSCDTVVVGGGSSGAVLAARLSADPGHRVILLEAGADFGRLDGGAWPPALWDPRRARPATAEWGYWNVAAAARESFPLACGKVIGGSSSINAGGFNWPMARDLSAWVAAGNESWDFASVQPCLRDVEDDPDGPGDRHGRGGPIPVAREPAAALTPFFAAFAAAALDAGHVWRPDINDPCCQPGLLRRARNTPGGTRWNTAFAYLDPARARANLRIMPRGEARRIEMSSKPCRAEAVVARSPDGLMRIRAGRVIVAAGAYNTPALLLRSGIGDADALRAMGGDVAMHLPGVGRDLRDHPIVAMHVLLSEALGRAAAAELGELVRYQIVLRGATTRAGEGFDIQIAPCGEFRVDDGWESTFRLELMRPRSRGLPRLATPDGPPLIDSNFLSDPDDLDAMAQAFALARDLLTRAGLRGAVARERFPGPATTGGALESYLRANAYSYHHPCGTCRMGPADDVGSVVGQDGAVHGVAGLFIVDASIMPAIPSVPLNLLVIAVAGRIAAMLA